MSNIKAQKKSIKRFVEDPRTARGEVNQREFWAKFGVTQSGGSRYENLRTIPKPTRMLMGLVAAGVVTDQNLADIATVV